MQKFKLNTVLDFNKTAPHPSSKIVGIDHYDFNANDGVRRQWESYTLVPVKQSDRQDEYERWYVVDLPDLGLSFVTQVNENMLPQALKIEDKLSGSGISRLEGDGEMGYGKINLMSYWDTSTTPNIMYAKETFDDGSIMYFKTVPLLGLKSPNL